MKSDSVRNLRSKVSVRSTTALPLKRNSEEVESSKEVENALTTAETTESIPIPIFPVKSVLKSRFLPSYIDKENINPVDWDDLDAEDSGDPLMVSDYVVEIFDYMKELEVMTFNDLISYLTYT